MRKPAFAGSILAEEDEVMRAPFHQVHVHLVWATWDRLPILDVPVAEVVVRAVRAKGSALGCPVIAIGWMPDHLHVLMQLKPSVALSELVRHVKGSSAHLVNGNGVGEKLRWQGGYGAFAVCRDHLDVVRAYVENQSERHAHHRLASELEMTEAEAHDAR